MPVRPLTRDQAWLLPPTLDEAIDDDHPVRFVGAFVDAIDSAAWADLGIAPAGAAEGAPAYHPRLLLSVWLYGVHNGRALFAEAGSGLPRPVAVPVADGLSEAGP
jgi:transposase